MITVNNKSYVGQQISISGNNVTIDGKRVILDENDKIINITVDASIESLNVDNCDTINVRGNVGTLETKNGNVSCGDVSRNVESKNGNIRCGSVGGNVTTKNGNIQRQ